MITYKDYEPINRQFLVSVRKFRTSDGHAYSALRFSMSNKKSVEWKLASDAEVNEIYSKVVSEFTPIQLTYSGGK